MLKRLFAFIPQKVNNRTVLRVLELLRRRRPVPEPASPALSAPYGEPCSFIEDQHSYAALPYGRSNMALAGCEVIAVYNALLALTGRQDAGLPALIAGFEQNGMVLHGHFGTSPGALAEFFARRHYKVRFSALAAEFDSIAAAADVSLLTFYNDARDIRAQIHTVCITRSPEGFLAHNFYCNGTLPPAAGSISALLSAAGHGQAKGISIIGISK